MTASDPGGLTILTTKHPLIATKRFTWHPSRVWIKKSYDKAKEFYYGAVWEMAGVDDLASAIQQIAAEPRNMVIRGALSDGARARITANPKALVNRRKHTRGGIEPDFVEVPRQWFMVDVDNFQLRACDDLIDDPEGAVAYAIAELLPPCFQDVRCFWQLSASAGFERGVLKAHIFYWITEPLTDAVLKRTLQQHAPGITDLSVYQGVQPHYVANPIIESGPDPIPRRFGWIDGMADAVALPALQHDEPRPHATGGNHVGGASDLGGDPLDGLGDGEGLAGFHLPLRSAALAYVRRVRLGAARDDAAFIAACRDAIDAAPRRPDRDVSGYDGDYLARSIAGAAQWLDGLDDAGGAAPEPPARPVRLPLAEARAAMAAAMAGFFTVAETFDAKLKAAKKAAKPAVAPEIWDKASDGARQIKAERDAARSIREGARRKVAEARAAFHVARLAVADAPRADRAARRNERDRRRAEWRQAREVAIRDRREAASNTRCAEDEDAEDAKRLKAEVVRIGRDVTRLARVRAAEVAGPPPVHAIRADVGAGKSTEARRRAAIRLATMRAAGDKRTIAFAVPTAKLGHEQVGKFADLAEAGGLVARVRLGRERDDPDAPGETMCRDLDAVDDANEALADVQTSICQQRNPDGTIKAQCAFFDVCGYQKQRRARADLWFLAHEHLFRAKPKEIGDPALVIVDESPWDAGLIGHDGHHLDLPADTIRHGDATIPGASLATARLEYLRQRLADVLDPHPDGPLKRAALIAAGFTPENAAEAAGLEWQRKIETPMWPGMPRKDRKEAAKAAKTNKTIPRLGMLWRAVAAVVGVDGAAASGWAALAVSETQDGPVRVLRLKGRREPAEAWRKPTLLIDATLTEDLIRPFWPTIKTTAEVLVDMPHQHVIQVADTTYSKRMLAQGGAMAAVHAIVCRGARRHMPGEVLTVLQAEAEARLIERGNLPANLATAHHNAIAGRDEWREAAALIVIGRTAPSPYDVERQAEALTGAAIEPLAGWYAVAPAAREMTDGTWSAARSDRHPHPIAEAMRWHAAEGELLQIIGRVRGADRTAANPVNVLVMCDTPIPVPVARLMNAADLAPSPIDRMLAAGGVVLAEPSDAARCYPGLWATGDAARMAFNRAGGSEHSLIGTYLSRDVRHLGLERVRYQLAGPGRRPALAAVDMAMVPEPRGWLEARLGRLCRFEVVAP